MNELISKGGNCRTAPATLGLLNSTINSIILGAIFRSFLKKHYY